MDYSQILKKAWDITKSNRFLWWLGILTFGAEGGSGFGSGGGGGSGWQDSTNNSSDKISKVFEHGPRVLGTTDNASNFFKDSLVWMGDHTIILIAIGLIILLLILLFGYISNTARAGLILSVGKIEDERKSLGFKKAFGLGKKFTWRLFGQNILFSLFMLLLILLLGIIFFVPYLINRTDNLLFLGILLSLFSVIPIVIVGTYLNILNRLASRFLVTEDLTIIESIRQGKKLFHQEFGKSVITWLIELVVSIVIAFIFIFAIFIIGAILFAIGFLINSFSPGALVIVYASVIAIAFFAGLIILSGIFSAFISSYWTISFRALRYIVSQK